MIEKPLQSESLSQEVLPAYRNPSLSVEDRLLDLLGRMDIDEKIAQMICLWRLPHTVLFNGEGKLDEESIRQNLRSGIGQIARISDRAGGQSPEGMAETANAIQKYLATETRLGIPAMFHEECLHGLVARDATSYPQPIGLASTFNTDLIEKLYSAVAEDARGRGAHQALGPVVDVARDPRWGRVEETFGEDPYLVSRMGIAAVRGFQGDATFKDKKRIIATLKHFAAHGQPESGTNCGPGNYSERVLRDVFLYPFKETIQKANALSIMPSYNEIDGVPSHANAWLLQDVLRKEWGFRGIVVSDYFAISELNERQEASSFNLAKDKLEAALLACEAGVNIELPDPDCYPLLSNMVQDGTVDESVIDDLISPLLRLKLQMGLFEDPYVQFDAACHERRIESGRTIALQAARETMTLLKNDGHLLPLNLKKGSTIAVIGPNADRTLLGGYSGKPRYFTTVLEGISAKAGKDAHVIYSEGCKLTVGGSWDQDTVTLPDPEENRKLIREAAEVAARADVVIMALGGNEQTSREAWSKVHLGDRANLDLFGMQNDLARAVVETGKPVVVLLFNGRPSSLNYVNDHVPAILECWYLGQETGTAVAEVLFGEFNPSGKLPISFPRSAGHLPVFYNHKSTARRGYLFDDISALYPFGYGLSYTNFLYSNLKLERARIGKFESTRVLVDVKNTGTRAGAEVVQMYIRDLISSVTRPVKELRGFRKIFLKPGETATVSLDILPEHLAFTNIDKEYVVEAGDFAIMVGCSSRDQDLMNTILHVE
ncbi:MAG TPA: beta-glucosidase [Bacteroidetes bacterium]|nr:beta-glucosidase [Bacteroidota bacterium]